MTCRWKSLDPVGPRRSGSSTLPKAKPPSCAATLRSYLTKGMGGMVKVFHRLARDRRGAFLCAAAKLVSDQEITR
jgi:hypothetical protein